MNRLTLKRFETLFFWFGTYMILALSQHAKAQPANEGVNYRPPSTPALHEKSDLDVGESREGSGPVIGANMNFGLANVAGVDDSARPSYTLGVEFGYNNIFMDRNRFEFGGEVFFGSLNSEIDNETAKFPVKVGFLAKIGYGKTLGPGGLTLLTKVGAGFAMTGYEYGDAEATEDSVGILLNAGVGLVVPMSTNFEYTVGAEWNHYMLNVDEIETKINSQIERTKINEDYKLNFYNIELGFRYII
ncbi:MAG: hypothetical protein KBD78_10230 [Oligoflexales bacterium]|nr:hypothetical protein [Oligoflexales bacterium]